jgi:hypothetical protein
VRAESALQNTIAVLDCGLLNQREAGDSDSPLLSGTRFQTPQDWGRKYFAAFAAYFGTYHGGSVNGRVGRPENFSRKSKAIASRT